MGEAKNEMKSMYDVITEIISNDARYKREAYVFVSDALNYTHSLYKKKRHVSGQELLEGIKKFALKHFGLMAYTVLKEWGIHNTKDFGYIVFNMVDAGLMGKTETDSLVDFENGYDFKKAFVDDYKIKIPE